MKLVTNIILVGNNGPTSSYMLEFSRSAAHINSFLFQKHWEGEWQDHHATLAPFNESMIWTRRANEWYHIENDGADYDLPVSNIRLYFPQYSADTYDSGCTYALHLATYVHGTEIELGSFIFRRSDALACPPRRFDGMDEYVEYIDFNIADPFTVLFGAAARDIRVAMGDKENINDTGSILHMCLSVVEPGEDCYIMKSGWTGGQNNMLISDPNDLKLNIEYNNDNKSLDMQLTYNEAYGDDFTAYLRDTYGINSASFIWEYVVMDDNNIYYEQSKKDIYEEGTMNRSFNWSFEINVYSGEVDPSDGMLISSNDIFSSWDNWRDGLYIQGSVSLVSPYGNARHDDTFATVFSNRIPITKELFALMVQEEGYEHFPPIIDLNTIDMNNVNLTAINNIKQEVTVVTPAESARNKVIQPVFYQTRDLGMVYIHPQVTENISINLDAYKSRVKTFMIQVEGVSFPEIGRTNKGIVFKVTGNMLPKNVDNGSLYVLDQDSILVTSGKYTYIY